MSARDFRVVQKISSTRSRQQCQEVEQTGNFAPAPLPVRKCRRRRQMRILAHCNRRERLRTRRHRMRLRHPSDAPARLAERGGVLYNGGSVTARAPIARKTGTGTLSPMDAYADRRETNALTHRQALLIVFG